MQGHNTMHTHAKDTTPCTLTASKIHFHTRIHSSCKDTPSMQLSARTTNMLRRGRRKEMDRGAAGEPEWAVGEQKWSLGDHEWSLGERWNQFPFRVRLCRAFAGSFFFLLTRAWQWTEGKDQFGFHWSLYGFRVQQVVCWYIDNYMIFNPS